MADIYHFISDNLKEQPEDITGENTQYFSFGPKSEDYFNITSYFDTGGANKDYSYTNAHAITKGQILVVRQKNNPKLANLILKPLETLNVPVKYFIYRGLELRFFAKTNNNNLTEVETGTEQNNKYIGAQLLRSQKNNTSTSIPLSALFGGMVGNKNIIDLYQALHQTENTEEIENLNKEIDELELEAVFLSRLDINSTLYTIETAGVFLSQFSSYGGLDIILDKPGYSPTMGMARADKHQLVIEEGETIEQVKEQIKYFIDPIAFYKLYNLNEIKWRSPSLITGFTTSIDRFKAYKNFNKIYLNIYNENNYTYNYYGNYTDRNIKINNTNSLSEAYIYGEDSCGWPIEIIDTTASGLTDNIFYIALKKDSSNTPHVIIGKYMESLKKDGDTKNTEIGNTYFINNLESDSDTGFTKPIAINAASYVELHYIRQSGKDDNLDCFYVKDPLSFVFGSIKDYTKGITEKETRETRYFCTADTTLVIETLVETVQGKEKTNLIFHANPIKVFNTKEKKKKSFNLLFFKGNSQESETFILKTTEAEYNTLLDSIQDNLSDKHEKYLYLQKSEQANTYKLSIAGLTSAGTFHNTGNLTVNSTNQKVFTSNGFMGNAVEVVKPEYIINFNRPDDYTKGRNHFGFDWFRDNVQDILLPHTGESKEEALNRLKKEYSTDGKNILKVYGNIDYYIPWLTMYPNHENQIKTDLKEVKLKISIGNLDPKKDKLDNNEFIYFETPEGGGIEIDFVEVNPSDGVTKQGNELIILASKVNNKNIIIKCNKESDAVRSIYVKKKSDNNTIGQLNIYPNQKKLEITPCLVKVVFAGTLSKDPDKFIFYENEERIDKIKIGQSDYDTITGKWEKFLLEDYEKNTTKNILHQCLVNYEPLYIKENEISISHTITIDFDNNKLYLDNKEYLDDNTLLSPINDFKKAIKGISLINREEYKKLNIPAIYVKKSDPDKSDGGLDCLYKILNLVKIEKSTKTPLLYYLPASIFERDDIENFFSHAFMLNNSLFLTSYPNTLNGLLFSNTVLAHESAHILKLKTHPFEEESKHKYTANLTENIMDYYHRGIDGSIENKISFWKWQTDIIMNNN